jgi:phage baseplate assembly protein W
MNNGLIPSGGASAILPPDFTFRELPTNTYKLHINEGVKDYISGYTDGADAVKQAIYLILQTERYEYIIYSWNYGVELRDLIGKPLYWCVPEVKRCITEALLQDTRITAVDGWEIETAKNAVGVSLHSIACTNFSIWATMFAYTSACSCLVLRFD